jgi:hypothetical protein
MNGRRSRASTKLFGALVAGVTVAAMLSPAQAQVPPKGPSTVPTSCQCRR